MKKKKAKQYITSITVNRCIFFSIFAYYNLLSLTCTGTTHTLNANKKKYIDHYAIKHILLCMVGKCIPLCELLDKYNTDSLKATSY